MAWHYRELLFDAGGSGAEDLTTFLVLNECDNAEVLAFPRGIRRTVDVPVNDASLFGLIDPNL